MLKYPREVPMITLVNIECIDYSWVFDCRVSSVLNNRAVSRGSYSMPKPREFVNNKSEATFRIASHFWTNIEYSHRVQTSIFVEIILWELIPESEYEFFLSVETSRFHSMPKLENFLNYWLQSQNYNWNRLTFLNKDLQFKEGLDEFFLGNWD